MTITHKHFIYKIKISYLLGIEENNYLTHLYFGKDYALFWWVSLPRTDRSFSPNNANAQDRLLSLDTLPLEFPGYGHGDFREPAHNIKLETVVV